MPLAIDRDTTLRKAEKLLRQGQLDGAISEYARVVEVYPRDWKTVNVLGDLFVRAGQVESAVAQYTRIAEHFAGEGFLSKAAAVYKKIVKIKPDDENALLKSAAIFEEQGLIAEAKTALINLADRRRRRGDKRGSAEIAARLGALDPSDLNARLAGAKAAAELGDTAGAITRFKEAAAALIERGRHDEGRSALAEAARLDPEDNETRSSLWRVFFDAGDLDQAAQFATSATEFKSIAVELASRGREEEALDTLSKAVACDPSDVETRIRLARSYVARGDLDRARTYLASDGADQSADLRIVLAEIELRSGHSEAGRSLLQKVLTTDPGRREELVLLGCGLCDVNVESAFQCVDSATDAAIREADWPGAASALHEFVTRVPNHIPALMKLVEICVDGGLEATMYSAQAQLADAYLDADRPSEARVIAEDLVAREPWERANIERFRRALVMLGESDPDAVIADRLSGDSPFTSTDFTFDLEGEPKAGEEPVPAGDEASPVEELVVLSNEVDSATDADRPPVATEAVEGESTPLGAKPPSAGSAAEEPDTSAFEIDLSDVLGDLVAKASADAGSSGVASGDLDAVFDRFRAETPDPGAQHFRLAVTYEEMGMVEQSLAELEAAARSPKYRFEAASKLARLARDHGKLQEAVEWFERAAEAPAPDAESGRVLLYDLAQTLTRSGENMRALALLMEIDAETPGYRDVGAQIERLRQSLQA